MPEQEEVLLFVFPLSLCGIIGNGWVVEVQETVGSALRLRAMLSKYQEQTLHITLPPNSLLRTQIT